jgi:hypothetical protein
MTFFRIICAVLLFGFAISMSSPSYAACPSGGSGTWNDPSGEYSGGWKLKLSCNGTVVTGVVTTRGSRQCYQDYKVSGKLIGNEIHDWKATTTECGRWSAPKPIKIGESEFTLNSGNFGDGVKITGFKWE